MQQAAREGDADALAVIDDFGRWVALGLVNLTNVLDPEMFVLGGGLAAGADLYLDPIKKWFGELIYQPELRPMPAGRVRRVERARRCRRRRAAAHRRRLIDGRTRRGRVQPRVGAGDSSAGRSSISAPRFLSAAHARSVDEYLLGSSAL